MINKIITLLIFISAISFSQNKILTQFHFEDDNEAQNTFKYYLGYNREVTDNFSLGVMGGYRKYIMPNIENTYKDLRLNASYSPMKNLSLKSNVSFLLSDTWNPVFYDGLITYSPIKLLYFEGYIERESVGSALSNANEYISTFIGISTDVNVAKNVTFVVGIANNTITDGNNRVYQSYRAIYTMPFEWMFIDLKAKIMNGGEYSPYYFSPNHFGEYNVGIGISTQLFSPQYYMRFYVGGGVHTVDDDTKGLFLSNIRLVGDFTKNISAELSYGLSNSVHNLYGAYLYNYGKLQINYNF